MSLDIHGCHYYLNVRWRARQHWVPHHALEMLLQLGCDGLQRLNAKKLWKYSLILTLCPLLTQFSSCLLEFLYANCCNHTGHFLIQNPCLLLLPDLKLSGSKTQHPEIRESRGYGWLGARTSRTILFYKFPTVFYRFRLNQSQFISIHSTSARKRIINPDQSFDKGTKKTQNIRFVSQSLHSCTHPHTLLFFSLLHLEASEITSLLWERSFYNLWFQCAHLRSNLVESKCWSLEKTVEIDSNLPGKKLENKKVQPVQLSKTQRIQMQTGRDPSR